MYERKIPTIDYLKGIANTQSDYNKSEDDSKAYNALWKYYHKFTDISIMEYNFEKENKDTYSTRTLLGVEENMGIDNIKVHDSIFSEYSEDNIEELNLTDSWNDTITDVIYKDNTFHIGESNYYSYTLATQLLWNEAIQSSSKELDTLRKEDFPIRNEIISSIRDLKIPPRPRALTSGGVIVMNTGEKWKLLLCKRSENVSMNKNRISIIPNGKMTYENAINNTFKTTLQKKFITELFSNSSQGEIFFEKHVTSHPVSAGWNLRDGDFSIGYILLINSPVAYDVFKDTIDNNEETQELIEVPINDFDKITEIVNFDKMSPTPISTVCESLKYIDENSSYPDLPYTISSPVEMNISGNNLF